LLAETPEGLQTLLDSLLVYAIKWDLVVNTDKTMIVIFRKGGKTHVNEHWSYNNTGIEVTDKFNYLGVFFQL